jgi:DNA polymerase-2
MTPPDPVRGFILQPTYRIEEGRAVVHLYGRLETGETFLVRDGRQVPCFWIRSADRETARGVRAPFPWRLAESDRRTLAGEPADRVEVPKPPDAPPLRDRLHQAGVQTFEADVRFAVRFLIDRGIRGSLAIRGESRPGHAAPATGLWVDRVYDEPELAPADWTPRLTVLSFDIETDPQAESLLSVALHGCGVSEVHMLCPEGTPRPDGVEGHPTEAELLAAFARRVRELDPDVITGWNVVDFDLRVLLRVAERYGGLLDLGRGPGSVRLSRARSEPGRRGPVSATVPGRSVLDGIQLLRGAFIRMESYALDAVAREILGEGKTLDAGDRGEEVLRLHQEDRAALAEYNRTDARLVLDVLERLELVELAVARSRLTGLAPDRMGASIAAFDFLYLSELGRRGIVAPTVGSASIGGDEAPGETAGGHVLEPRPGLYENVAVFDFKSLYPSLIRTFGLDPLNLVPGGEEVPEDDVVVAPNGAAFRRAPGILPALLDELFPRREEARRAGDGVAAYAIKILMNSFYGVLATPACRFYSPPVANAITAFGRQVLLWTRNRIEEGGRRVLYGDTDSLFVETGEADSEAARAAGRELAEALDRDLADWVAERYRVESRLELQLERLYLKLLLPPVRGGARGARKRYAGLVEEGGETKTVFTGMEVVRRDWTDLARRAQQELYERLFSDRPVEDYLRRMLDELRDGRLDALLVYHKGLRKDPSEYTSTTPPHVAAARKLPGPPPDVVAYVMTEAGPEPAAHRAHAYDYEHYIDKQLRPVAEPVLELLHKSFDELAGWGHQMGLF